MSRRRGEFEHRTSIFEGAFRAWSHLGGLEPSDLETMTLAELDPLTTPLTKDGRQLNGKGFKEIGNNEKDSGDANNKDDSNSVEDQDDTNENENDNQNNEDVNVSDSCNYGSNNNNNKISKSSSSDNNVTEGVNVNAEVGSDSAADNGNIKSSLPVIPAPANSAITTADTTESSTTSLTNKRQYPYEPLPRAGLTHPFVQAILSPWLGADADEDAIQLGLTTLRTWWQHRRKGESGSAMAALGTDRMRGVVDGYMRHFFNLAHCLVTNEGEQPPRTLMAKRRRLEKQRNKQNRKRVREEEASKLAALALNAGIQQQQSESNNNSSSLEIKKTRSSYINSNGIATTFNADIATIINAGAAPQSAAPMRSSFMNRRDSLNSTATTRTSNMSALTSNNALGSSLTAGLPRNPNNGITNVSGNGNSSDMDSYPIATLELLMQAQRQQLAIAQLEHKQSLTSSSSSIPLHRHLNDHTSSSSGGSSNKIAKYKHVSNLGGSSSSTSAGAEPSSSSVLMQQLRHLQQLQQGSGSNNSNDIANNSILKNTSTGINNHIIPTSLSKTEINTSSAQSILGSMLSKASIPDPNSITSSSSIHSSSLNNALQSSSSSSPPLISSKPKSSCCSSKNNYNDSNPKNNNTPTTTPVVFVSGNDDIQIAMSVEGITCAHCVKIVETVLRGCNHTSGNGQKSPINGLLDAAANMRLRRVLLKIDRSSHAKRIAFEASRNLAMVGYTAHVKEMSIKTSSTLPDDNECGSNRDLSMLCRAFLAVGTTDRMNVFNWDLDCSCPDYGVIRDDCARHSQMNTRIFEAFDSREDKVNQYMAGCSMQYGSSCQCGDNCKCNNCHGMEDTRSSVRLSDGNQSNASAKGGCCSSSSNRWNSASVARSSSFTRNNNSTSRSNSFTSGRQRLSIQSGASFGRAMSGLSAIDIDWENMTDFDVNVDHSSHINKNGNPKDPIVKGTTVDDADEDEDSTDGIMEGCGMMRGQMCDCGPTCVCVGCPIHDKESASSPNAAYYPNTSSSTYLPPGGRFQKRSSLRSKNDPEVGQNMTVSFQV